MTTPAPGSTTPVTPPAPGAHMSPVEPVPPTGTPAPPATTTAPATPVQTPPATTAEPTTLEVEGEEGEKKGTFTYEPTGDNKLDMALTFVGKHGFGPGHPALVAAVNGDFSLLKAQLAEKQIAGADAYVALAEAAYERMHAVNEKRRADDKAALHTFVGGEENWTAITEWAKANADEAEAAEINGMLGLGGVQMKIAAGYLASAYERATGGLPEGSGSGPAVSESRGASAATTNALSGPEYGRAVAKAQREHRGREPFEQSKTYADLRARRERFRD